MIFPSLILRERKARLVLFDEPHCMGTCILLFMIIERKWKRLCKTNNEWQSIQWEVFRPCLCKIALFFAKKRIKRGVKRKDFDSYFHCIFLSFFLAGLVTKVRLRTPALNVSSVAEWLALPRYQWWCIYSVSGSNLRWLNTVGSLAKPRRSSESGRMGNTSPATELLRRYSTWPQILRIARQEVALPTHFSSYVKRLTPLSSVRRVAFWRNFPIHTSVWGASFLLFDFSLYILWFRLWYLLIYGRHPRWALYSFFPPQKWKAGRE